MSRPTRAPEGPGAISALSLLMTLRQNRAMRTRTIELELNSETRQVPEYARMAATMLVPTLTIAHHPRLERVGDRAMLLPLTRPSAEVEVSRLTPEFTAPRAKQGLPLASAFLSRKPVVLRADGGRLVVDASALGEAALKVDGVAVRSVELTRAQLEAGVVLELGGQIVLLLHLAMVDDEQFAAGQAVADKLGLVGESDAVRAVREAIVRAAKQTGPVLVRGETGTGKELAASALHKASTRAAEPYITANMAAIPPTLAASELFGHAKGAFSGAHQGNAGLFGRAHGGTLFMDEIGDTPLDVQAALLRVMETGEVQQVGADKVRVVDVRIIAATDADLDQAITQGRFRAPLRYRLSNQEVVLPPLRARKDDLGRLLVHFVATDLAAAGRQDELKDQTAEETSWIPAALVARLLRYAWPGNVRQLRSVARWLAGLDHRARPVDPNDPALAALLVGEAPDPADAAAIGAPATATSGVGSTTPTHPAIPSATASAANAASGASASNAPERRKSSTALVSPAELERLMELHDYKLGNVADALGLSRPALNDLVDAHPRLKRAQNLSLEEIEAARAACGDLDGMWRYLKVSEKSLKLRMSALGLL